MIVILYKIAKIFWKDLNSLNLPRQLVAIGDIITTIYSTIIYIIGIFWLTQETDWGIFQNNWPMLIYLTGIILLFTYLNFFMIIEFREDRYGSASGAFNSMAVWTAALIFGPTSLWIIVFIQIGNFLISLINSKGKATFWNNLRSTSLGLAGFTIPYLIGLKTYSYIGGTIPIGDLSQKTIISGLVGIGANFFTLMLIWLPYFIFAVYTQKRLTEKSSIQPILTFFFLALSLPTIAHPFSILGAGLYTQYGGFVFTYFICGLIVVAYLARQFSLTGESNRQQTRQLEKLEQLGRDILTAPPDASTLPDILSKHIPNMFPSGNIAIWMIPGQTLFKSPEDWEVDFGPIWDWACNHKGAKEFMANEKLPWAENNSPHRPIVCTPIVAYEGTEVIGGIYLELRRLAQPWNRPAMKKLFPALHTLADQISSAIHQAEEYAQSIALQKVSQEIQLAGQIQASFLPNKFPNIPGWELAVTLEPAGGLSGDFFDLIPLSRNRLGIVIADVADKGLGAALYMALCRTLIRTYALEYHARPDLVFSETNERILADARANLFITCFYGVLDPTDDTLIYCNAGHNPPYLHRTNNGKLDSLGRTGIPIGIDEDMTWERETVEFSSGDKLVLYTDGITEAKNEFGEFYNEERLIKVIQDCSSDSAYDLQLKILKSVKDYARNTPQSDDIALMILEKELE